MQSNQSRPRHPSRPLTTADWVMKFFMKACPGSMTGTFLILYLDKSNRTVNILLFVKTGRKGVDRNDLTISHTCKGIAQEGQQDYKQMPPTSKCDGIFVDTY